MGDNLGLKFCVVDFHLNLEGSDSSTSKKEEKSYIYIKKKNSLAYARGVQVKPNKIIKYVTITPKGLT